MGSLRIHNSEDRIRNLSGTANNIELLETFAMVQPFVSFAQFSIISFNILTICIPTCILGIFSNLINIIVFLKMGFLIPTNISLFSLAVADLLSLCIALIGSVGAHPAIPDGDLTFPIIDLYRTAVLVYYSVLALGSWITAIINIERSCCVAFPLKVRQIFTRKTIVGLIGGMVIFQIASGLPRSFGVRLAWTNSALTNSTKLRYVIYNPRLVTLSFLASYSIPNLICFVVVVLGTIFLISKFKQSRELRESMSSAGDETKKAKMSEKDIRLVRSMIFISAIYIFGAAPGVLLFAATSVFPALHYDNPYLGTLTFLLYQVSTLFQAFSSSVNIFVYLNMGTNFKRALRELFFLKANAV